MATADPAKTGAEAHDLKSSDAKLTSTSHESHASQPQHHFTHRIPPPLHIDKDLIHNSGGNSKAPTSGETDNVQASRDAAPKYQHTLSFESERIVGKTVEELSQLRSPILREILHRLEGEDSSDKLHASKPPSGLHKRQNQKSRHLYADLQVGPRWRTIQGSTWWDGLLDPIEPVLKAEIIRYGEFAQATYDCFDSDPNSKYCGSCKFTKDVFFDKLELDNCGYEVTQFLYATAQLDLPNFFAKSFLEDTWSKDSNWIGYVAVTTSPEEIARLGRRDIVIAWRGTVTKFEWIKDVQDYATPASFDPRHGDESVLVESGFLSVYTSSNAKSRYNQKSARAQVLSAVSDLIEKYKDEELSITVTGHSLGSALATLCGYDLAESQMNLVSGHGKPEVPPGWHDQDPSLKSPLPVNSTAKKTPEEVKGLQGRRIPITVISFAGPRVGNRAFRDRVKELGVAVLRVANKHDLVTKVPGVLFQNLLSVLQPILPFVPAYKHAGVKLKINHLNSYFLEPKVDVANAHNLEGYLHVVDGFHSSSLPFQPTLRDYALVNKRSDFLKREYYIPANWWQEAYKGLRKDESGHWLVPPRDVEIFPTTPTTVLPADVLEKETPGSAAFFESVSVAAQRSSKIAETPRAKGAVHEGDVLKTSTRELILPTSGGTPSKEVTPSKDVTPSKEVTPPTSEVPPSKEVSPPTSKATPPSSEVTPS